MVRQTEIEVTKLLDPERVMLSQVGKVELTALERDILHYITKRMSDGVMITAPDGAYIVYNEKAKLITGISEPHRAGPDFWVDQFGCFREDRVTPYVPQELPLVKAMQGQATDHATMFLRNPKIGDGRYIDISARQIKDPQSGAVKGTVVVFGELSK
jgi:two-component system, NtrC family, sensor kinase